MDRNREARRLTMAAAANGLSRRRHRASNLRYSPEDDGAFGSPETARLRDRGASLKKDRDRERDREKERERERDRFSSRSKRKGGEKLMMHGHRDGGGDDSSEESINVDEEEAADDGGGGGLLSSAKMLPPSNSNRSPFSSSSLASHHNSSGSLQHRKSFPPPTKVIRAPVTSVAASPAASTWKAADEMIGVSVPRKARSASTKRSQEPWSSSASGVVFASSEQIHGQRSTSPARASPASLLTSSSPPAPTSPSSSSASVRKKMPMGQKQRPPKSTSSRPSSSPAENDIEIEIAEVLYGMMRQPSGPTKQETLGNDSTIRDCNEVSNKSTSEAKSRISSPKSNSQPSAILAANSSSANTPVSVIAPKRKRPRPVKYEEEKNNSVLTSRCSSMPSTSNSEIEISAKFEAFNKEDKMSGSKVESCSGFESSSQADLPSQQETHMPAVNPTFDLNPLVEDSQKRDANPSSNNGFSSGMKLDDNGLETTATKVSSPAPEKENRREENFEIDLMAPARSPEREYGMNRVAAETNMKAVDVETEAKSFFKKTDKADKNSCKEDLNLEHQGKKMKITVEPESRNQDMNIDVKFDLEKCDRDGSTAANGNKVNHLNQKQPHLQQPTAEKTAQANALPPHMSIPGWPGGLPPMGYMAPLQGVVSMDGSSLSSATMQPPHMLFNQPRPKRCATHCYIARNIHYHQQFTKMNPFWHAAAGSAPIYGAKPCNLSLMPPSEIQANASVRVSHSSLDKNSHSTSSGADNAAQRKQILLQQTLPPGATNNIMHGPAFIFPLSQQPQAASVRPAMAGNTASGTGTSTSVSANGSAAATPIGATTMSLSYPNLPGNETQYLAILQNNAYPFPVPAHVGAPPGYRGTPGQAIPFFNGQFYPPQMLHTSHLQPQPQQLQVSQAQQSQKQGNQNLSNSTGPSAALKQLQGQQQRPGNSSGTLQGFPQPKTQSQPSNFQQRQNAHHQSEMAGEDGPSTADHKVSRHNVTYGQNIMMPMQTPNFGITCGSVRNGSNNSHVEKKSQQQSSKAGVEAFTSQPFAMSFSAMDGVTSAAPSGVDISSTAQNHAMFNSLPEAARQGYQMMAAAVAAQAAQQKMNFRASEDGKREPKDGSNVAEERKSMEKTTTHTGQSIAFSRPDLSNANNVVDSSAWLLNLGSAPSRVSNGSSVPPAHLQMLRNQQQQQHQMLQLQKQQQYAAAAAAASAARNKMPVTSNGTVLSDHNVTSSSVAATKLPNNLTGFSNNTVQTSGGHGQSPQWKNNNSSRTSTSQVSSPSMSSSSNPSSLKNVNQKSQTRSQQAQISFAANTKSSPSAQVQQAPNSNQAPSPSVLAGSPSTSSASKSAGGSPRTTASTSTGNKPGQASSLLSSQPAKNSQSPSPLPSGPNQLQSGGRNAVSSIPGNPTAAGTVTKPQYSHQQPQQPPKHALQQAQLFFSGAYMQPQQQHSSSNINNNMSPAGGYYLQRHQQQTASSTTSSSLTNSVTCDPAKAIAAAAASAANNLKQGLPRSSGSYGSATQTAGKTHQHVPPGFPYVHAVTTTVQAKPGDQKQGGGE